ncbi:FAD-binding protein [Ginsengibacter hankyongi]|uniref:FAD-binding protein n=1 Tax=Ginsengibacter hankyongi TaxID=2607284 RepID=A0A5J5IJY2_9BACT|nr:FAD-dependent oxidoreductase [Ginsengibacter hankyongi]KAA9041395.1 FAD-binding protein [Ginsengibacter hankyongi]
MQQKILLKLLPGEALDPLAILRAIAKSSGIPINDVTGYNILKKSIDARGKTVWINITANAFIKEPFVQRAIAEFNFKDVSCSPKKIVIVGAGPAGLFAALQLIELGIKPVIIERGKDVKERRRDLALLNKKGIINPESNYCFGEGGAGTYSDGKLYTRSTKRGNIDRILNLFVHFGAGENILYEAHPHIGTNKLPQIITAMRKRILDCGGEFYFNKKIIDFKIENKALKSVQTEDGNSYQGDAFILATGHSARDIFTLLNARKLLIVAKPFALGVRVEHPQELINNIQYGNYNVLMNEGGKALPPASYSLVEQADGRGVFSFCMCPGGIIAPAATNDGELVVNGWSPSKRNNPYANSGLVVQVEIEDVINTMGNLQLATDKDSPLLMMEFQRLIEQKAFAAGGGNFVGPAQRLVDFTENKYSSTLPKCSYLPGIQSAQLNDILPHFIYSRLQKALKSFGKKMPGKHGHSGYFTNEAVLVATESRTSSPVRIPRDHEYLNHPQVKNLFPCGEGAGYAGGIVSAAMDGERIAMAIKIFLHA